MLSLAEYVASIAELARLARETEKKVKIAIEGEDKAIAAGKTYYISRDYLTDYHRLLGTLMGRTAQASKEHYEKLLGFEHVDDDVVDKVIAAQFEDEYYGATLTQRLAFNEQILGRRITQSAHSGQLDTVWTGPSFGSQLVTDRRLMLGTAVKIEHDMAKEFATLTEHKLMQWTLSHKHRQPDICDDLATNVDKGVVAYIKFNNLDLNPKGLYFVDSIPPPPHPNCQCEYGIVVGAQVKHSRVEIAMHKARKLLERVWGK